MARRCGGGDLPGVPQLPAHRDPERAERLQAVHGRGVPAAFTQTPAAARRADRELVKYAQCMRSHGVNIPDPTTSGGGPGGGGFAFGAQGGTNFRALLNTPAFKTASAACASLRPKFGGGRFGGGGPGGGRRRCCGSRFRQRVALVPETPTSSVSEELPTPVSRRQPSSRPVRRPRADRRAAGARRRARRCDRRRDGAGSPATTKAQGLRRGVAGPA